MKSTMGVAVGLAMCLIMPAVAAEADPQSGTPPAHPLSIDKERVTLGRRDFQVLQDGQPAGRITVHSSWNEQGEYLLHDHSESAALGIVEEIFVVMDGSDFRPLRSLVQGRFNKTYVNIGWSWEGTTASGRLDSYELGSGTHRHLQRELSMPAGTLTRAAVLYLIPALSLSPDQPLQLNWFDSMSGAVVPITLSVEGKTTVSVPAGEFEVWQISQRGGTPENTIYLSTAEPRRIVRFDVSGAPIRLELMAPVDPAAELP